MASTYHASTATKIQTLISALGTALGIDFKFAASPGFRITLEVSANGQDITVSTSSPTGPSNAFNAAATPTPPLYTTGAAVRSGPIKKTASELP